MSFAVRKFEVACNTATGNQTISPPGGDPGLGAAKAVIFFGVCLTADGAGAHARFFMGAAEAGGGDGHATFTSDDNAGTGIGGGTLADSAAIKIQTAATTPTTDAIATVTTWNSDGSIVVNWSDAPSSAWRLHGLILYGSDITNTAVGLVTTSTGTGSKSVTGLGFQPDFVLRFGIAASTEGRSNGAHFDWCMFTASDQVAGGLLTIENTTMNNDVAQRSGRSFWSPSSAGATLFDVTLTSMDSGGWTENWAVNAGSSRYIYLAIKGPRVKVGLETKPTSATNKDTTAPGFPAAGGLMFSWGQVASTSIDASSAECAKQSVGAWDDQGNEGSVWFGDDDNIATSESNMRTSATKGLQFTSNFTGTVDAEADFSEHASGFSANWTTADAVASEFAYAVFGANSASGSSAQTLPSLTQAASGSSLATGTSAQTIPALTQAASGSGRASGTSAQTLPTVTQAASGTATATGTAPQTLPTLTQSAAGTSTATGTSAMTLPALTQSASGGSCTGSVAQTLPTLTQASAGTATATGSATSPLPSLTTAAAGTASATGTAASALPSLTSSAAATAVSTGTVMSVLPSATQTATGAGTASGTVTSPLPSLTQSASGNVEDGTVSGSIAQVLPSLTTAASGAGSTDATAASTLPALTQSSSGTGTASGSVGSTLPSLAQAAAGSGAASGSAGSTLPAIVQVAGGDGASIGDVAQTLPVLSQSATGNIDTSAIGSIASAIPAVSSVASGQLSVAAIVAQAFPSLTQSLTGFGDFHLDPYSGVDPLDPSPGAAALSDVTGTDHLDPYSGVVHLGG